MKTRWIILMAAVSAFLLTVIVGCGYSIHGRSSLPFGEITIGLIENRTVEPKLEDRLYRALAEEFSRQGVRVVNSAGHKLTAVIIGYELISLSEKQGVTSEYRISVTVDFRLTGPDGKVREMKNMRSPFIVSISGSGDLGGLLASKETAEDKAMTDMAMEAVGALMFR